LAGAVKENIMEKINLKELAEKWVDESRVQPFFDKEGEPLFFATVLCNIYHGCEVPWWTQECEALAKKEYELTYSE
jgi:hypothetical protein